MGIYKIKQKRLKEFFDIYEDLLVKVDFYLNNKDKFEELGNEEKELMTFLIDKRDFFKNTLFMIGFWYEEINNISNNTDKSDFKKSFEPFYNDEAKRSKSISIELKKFNI